MKHYAILFIILSLVSCRSNRSIDRTVQEGLHSEKSGSVIRSDSSSTNVQRSDSSSSIRNEIRLINTTGYRPDGSIEYIRNEWIGIEAQEKSSSNANASGTKVSNEKVDSTAIVDKNKNLEEKEKSTADSRPVQGVEWLWIILGIAGVAGVVLLIIYVRYGRKQNNNQ